MIYVYSYQHILISNVQIFSPLIFLVSCGGDKNAFTTTCGNACSRRTCAILNDEPFFCTTECSGIEECNCKSGYVIHEGKCIPISSCRKIQIKQ